MTLSKVPVPRRTGIPSIVASRYAAAPRRTQNADATARVDWPSRSVPSKRTLPLALSARMSSHESPCAAVTTRRASRGARGALCARTVGAARRGVPSGWDDATALGKPIRSDAVDDRPAMTNPRKTATIPRPHTNAVHSRAVAGTS
jgi:hypothetical protein